MYTKNHPEEIKHDNNIQVVLETEDQTTTETRDLENTPRADENKVLMTQNNKNKTIVLKEVKDITPNKEHSIRNTGTFCAVIAINITNPGNPLTEK